MKRFFQSVLFGLVSALVIVLPAHAYYSLGNPAGFVNDYSKEPLFTVEQKQLLETKLTQFEQTTGNELVVVVIPSLQRDTIENFAVKLFDEWGIGKEKTDNGVLVLVAMEDRKMRIEVGYGLEGVLTDAESSWIISGEMRPAFERGEYYQGIDDAVNRIIDVLGGGEIPGYAENQAKQRSDTLETFGFMLLNACALVLMSVLGRTKSYWLGGLLGVMAGAGVWWFTASLQKGLMYVVILGISGLVFDYVVSRVLTVNDGGLFQGGSWKSRGGRSGRSGSGFGGFGGGSSGGGGASGSW